jgi:hypothetical protein
MAIELTREQAKDLRSLPGKPPQGKKPKYFYRPKPTIDKNAFSWDFGPPDKEKEWGWARLGPSAPSGIGVDEEGFEDWAKREYKAMESGKRSLFGQIPPPMLQAREIPFPGTEMPDVTWKRKHGREIKGEYGAEPNYEDWEIEGLNRDNVVIDHFPWKYGVDQWNQAEKQAKLRLEEVGLKLTKANVRGGTILALANQANDDIHETHWPPFHPAARLFPPDIAEIREKIKKEKQKAEGKEDEGKKSMNAKLNRHLKDSRKNREIRKALEKK